LTLTMKQCHIFDSTEFIIYVMSKIFTKVKFRKERFFSLTFFSIKKS